MNRQLVKAIVILPGTALVYVPGAIVWLTSGLPGGMAPPAAAEARFWIGAVLAASGFAMAVWTVRLFATAGQGTPAPWAPPEEAGGPCGPYPPCPQSHAVERQRHARRRIPPLRLVVPWPPGWSAFILLNTTYFIRSEEPVLERRFGESYRRYKANVPRWIPRWRPWDDA